MLSTVTSDSEGNSGFGQGHHHRNPSIVSRNSGGVASTRCIFYEQDTSWPETSQIAVARLNVHLPTEEEEELSMWGGMPVAEPTRRRMEQHEVLGPSEGRDVNGRSRRREIDGLELHFLVGEVRLPLGIGVQTPIRDFCHMKVW